MTTKLFEQNVRSAASLGTIELKRDEGREDQRFGGKLKWRECSRQKDYVVVCRSII